MKKAEIRMRSTVFSGAFLLFCLLGALYVVAKPEYRFGFLFVSPPQPPCPFLFSPYFFPPILQGVGGVICRACNLSIPFHGCLLDFGTCRTKPGQYCMKETHSKDGIQWYSVKGCTESKKECFQRTVTPNEVHSTHCCYRSMCNF
ncbi:LOW QUALITY PROTEIN: uncharacterized protein C9orf57 homolog [Sus scrofa]|uniref:LOW QUALITY PROTEIN: uncharacterized protein C9orf57 homolog n=1 Tax=Sus scrofa TaxID=9823 RepID=UPI000A2B3555|nr:LOW QUALITY PROTEIN: uncharacterized protein C9orf57 homolog [Sus scrofa]